MLDIARALNISKSTVSKAFNNRDDLAVDLKQKILAKAAEMGYNFKIKKMNSKSLTMGVMVSGRFFGSDESYYQDLYTGLSQAATLRGHAITLKVVSPFEENSVLIPNLPQIDGWIILGKLENPFLFALELTEKPFVLLDYYNSVIQADAIFPDDFHHAYRLTQFLIKKGYTSIGYCGNQKRTSGMQDRFLGFYKALLENDLELPESWIFDDRDEQGKICIPKISPPLPQAFVAVCDATALQLMEVLKRSHINIPKDIAIVGFDNTLHAQIAVPALTTWTVDKSKLTEEAIITLEQRILEPTKPVVWKRIGGTLVLRESH
jgi:LacI family transcriptional regulator